jgi:hypothetical protein
LFRDEVRITQDKLFYQSCSTAKINYSNEIISDNEIQIIPHGLVFQSSIEAQTINCFDWKGVPAFFQTSSLEISFDLFSAAFFLIARFEEWLPNEPDHYGRYAHTSSVAFKNNFLHLPLVQIWLKELEWILQVNYPAYRLYKKDFSFVPTYDVDIAFSYLHQPLLKNVFGFFRDLLNGKLEMFLERGNVYAGKQKDPFDQFKFLDSLNKQYQLPALYFFLLAQKRRGVDKNIHPSKKALIELIKRTAKDYEVGIHPSWQSGEEKSLLEKEIKTLSKLLDKPVTQSRQHYLKMTIPETYPRLIEAGIKKDYTLGYGTSNGFRASYATAFYWYDLKNETQTELEIHPFCYMDANNIFELRSPVYEAKLELQELFDQVKRVNGEMVAIFHNHFLTDQPEWVEWKKMYAEFIAENFGT